MPTVTPHKHMRVAKWAAASSIALALGACGGGGGGSVARTPPPPSAPPPPPPAVGIFAPARATVAPDNAPVLANAANPNFTTGPAPGTVFPLLQTTLTLDGDSIEPDTRLNAAGGTATVSSGQLRIQLADGDYFVPQFDSNLDWTSVGYWSDGGAWDCLPCGRGVFVAGYETPVGSMQTTGTATYTGVAQGSVFYPANPGSGVTPSGEEVGLAGTASFTANFGTRNLSGSLTNMTAGGAPWNNVSFSSTISGNAFSGTTSVTNAPSGAASLAGNATGTLEGKFFGPSAQEAGAVWTLFDGTKAAIGTLSGSRNSGGCGWQGEC